MVGQYADIGGDASVVKHVGGQGDNGLDQIILQQIAADLRLATARVAGKKRRAVNDDADT
ncbi:hypothetical protein D3C87_1944800 [compost metagenome]